MLMRKASGMRCLTSQKAVSPTVNSNAAMAAGLWLRMNTISELSVDSSRGEMMDINVSPICC